MTKTKKISPKYLHKDILCVPLSCQNVVAIQQSKYWSLFNWAYPCSVTTLCGYDVLANKKGTSFLYIYNLTFNERMPERVKSGKLGNNSPQTTSRSPKRFPIMLRDMRKLPVSPDGTMYQVSFSAVVRRNYGAGTMQLDFTRCYLSAHPLIALGIAISDIETDYFDAAINVGSISITRP